MCVCVAYAREVVGGALYKCVSLIKTEQTEHRSPCHLVPAFLHQLIGIRLHFTEAVITMWPIL